MRRSRLKAHGSRAQDRLKWIDKPTPAWESVSLWTPLIEQQSFSGLACNFLVLKSVSLDAAFPL